MYSSNKQVVTKSGFSTVIKVRMVTLAILFSFIIVNLSTSSVFASQAIYRFGVVPQFEPRKLADIWIPIFREIEQRSGLEIQMVGSPRIGDFETAFLDGEFDFAYMNPYHAMLALRNQGYVPLIRDGSRRLSGILVVRNDSSIKTIQELDGLAVAFPSPNALGASLLMRYELESDHGVRVNPLYVHTHSSVYLNVILDKSAAGGGVMSTLESQRPAIREKLRVIYETRTIAPHPIVVHPRVPEQIRRKLQKTILDIAITPEGQALLERIPIKQAVKARPEDYTDLQNWRLERFYIEN